MLGRRWWRGEAATVGEEVVEGKAAAVEEVVEREAAAVGEVVEGEAAAVGEELSLFGRRWYSCSGTHMKMCL